MKRILSILFALSLFSALSLAQSNVTFGTGDTKRSGSSTGMVVGGSGKMSNAKIDPSSIPMEHSRYYDESLKAAEQELAERAWGSEDTAWERACAINTKEAYQKYAAMYPCGGHIAEANSKIVDFEVDDIFKGEYGTLPGFNHVVEDDHSPTSIIVVENATGYPLSIYYSGPESKKIVIKAGGKINVCVKNGYYRVAASVPDPSIRPYAGNAGFSGGRYETGYCIVAY